jgi:catechol 2,3-dioxygenase-like lactoylglutathione lyase family enzyme
LETPLRIAEIDHVVLRCRDQKRMLDFYTRVLGFAEERRIEQLGLVQLRAGSAMIDLAPLGEAGSDAGRNMDHVCLGIETADINAAARYLRENNVEVMGEPAERYGAHGMGLSIYVRDPDGNVIELKQLPRTS